jgi:hypothetical protein
MRRLLTSWPIICHRDMLLGPDLGEGYVLWATIEPGLSCLQSGWAEQKLERRARTRPYSPASAKQNRGGKQQTARTTARPDSTIPPRRRRTGARDPEHKGRQQPYPPTIAHQKQSVPHSPETMTPNISHLDLSAVYAGSIDRRMFFSVHS